MSLPDKMAASISVSQLLHEGSKDLAILLRTVRVRLSRVIGIPKLVSSHSGWRAIFTIVVDFCNEGQGVEGEGKIVEVGNVTTFWRFVLIVE